MITFDQQQAIETVEKDVIVLAGAGSGKTLVLAERILHLLERGVSPSEIMCLTFTRKAAGELISRLERPIGNMLIGTFHSVAFDIIRAHADKLGYDAKSITIIDNDDSTKLLEIAARNGGYLQRSGHYTAALSAYRLGQYLACRYADKKPTFTTNKAHVAVIDNYWILLHQLNSLDFGQILRECRRLFAENPEVLAEYNQRIKHVLVDELQDSNNVQYALHKLFSPPATFFGVADPRQSIYLFLGARPKLLETGHEYARKYSLPMCFRCGRSIIEAANRLIDPEQQEPLTVSKDESSGKVKESIITIDTANHAMLVQIIRNLGETGYAWSDIAVLGRRHQTLKSLASKMDGVPFYRVRTADAISQPSFRIVHSLLRLMVNHRDDIAMHWCHAAIGINDLLFAELGTIAAAKGISIFEAAAGESEILQNISAMDPIAPVGAAAALIEGTLRRPGWCLQDTEVHNPIDLWVQRYKGLSVRQALLEHASRDASDDIPDNANSVTLMTVHAAKGLEWPCVVVLDCNAGEFPSSRAKEDDEKKEERRLFYVAMTRAKERLILHVNTDDSKSKPRGPSPFIQEAGL